jgi:hypothetical protein
VTEASHQGSLLRRSEDASTRALDEAFNRNQVLLILGVRTEPNLDSRLS